MRMRTPRSRRRPTGTPRPKRTIASIGQVGQGRRPTQAQLTKIRQRQKPTGTPTRAMPTSDPRIRKKPTGTPRLQKLKPGAIAPQRLPSKPPTSAQKAAMRKQAIARFGNVAERRKRQDAAVRKLERQGKISPGQRRSIKLSRQKFVQGKFTPKRTTKRKSRRLI